MILRVKFANWLWRVIDSGDTLNLDAICILAPDDVALCMGAEEPSGLVLVLTAHGVGNVQVIYMER